MYSIIRVVLKHKADINPVKSVFARLDCTRREMIASLYLLKRLADSENIGYKTIGSDTRVRYHVTELVAETIETMSTKVKGIIEHNISVYNEGIRKANMTLKRANAKHRGRDTTVPLREEANLKDYLSPFANDVRYEYIDKVIIVGDE